MITSGWKPPAATSSRNKSWIIRGWLSKGPRSSSKRRKTQLEKFEKSRPIQQREAEAKLATAKANQQRLLTTVQLESLKKGLVAAAQKLELSVIGAPTPDAC